MEKELSEKLDKIISLLEEINDNTNPLHPWKEWSTLRHNTDDIKDSIEKLCSLLSDQADS